MKVKICKDPWINIPLSNKVQFSNIRSNVEDTLDKLISDGCPRWKNDLINDLFTHEKANLIKAIPLSLVDRED